MFSIEDELKKLPTTPGVYLHKDSLGEVIYVGKAVNLRNRVRSYFRKQSQHDPKVRAMVSNIAEFEYISCSSEMEALLLECNLIKKYLPRYNILLKDDKSYPYIVVSLAEKFPRVYSSRRVLRDGSRYFGPFSDAGAVKRIVGMLDEMYRLKKCRQQEFRNDVRPCLNYFIGKCPGVCIGEADREGYMKSVDEIVEILGGKSASVIRRLESQMKEASENLQYEEAAQYRDNIKALRALGETQRATIKGERDIDVLIPVISHKTSVVASYKVRDGKLSAREIIYLREEFSDRGAELGDIGGLRGAELGEGVSQRGAEILASFIKQHYPELASLPREILLPTHIEDEALIAEMLDRVNIINAENGSDVLHKTKITVPERGEKKALIKMAAADSIELAGSLDEKATRERERRDALRSEISSIIEYAASASGNAALLIPDDDEREYRIEAYDISNFNGLDTVGGMVVYEGRKAIRNDYRKFKVRTAEGDDYGSLREVVYRRLKRAKAGDEGFSIYPDLMMIDGGLGQVGAVKAVLDAFRIAIPVVGLAKDDSHRTRAIVFEDGHEIDLKDNRLLFSYCGMVQEEVHRFAITYMSGVKGKRMIHSVLEEIPGIGPTRRKSLMQHFGSIDAIKNADYEELTEAEGMTSKAAESVLEFFSEK
ncbi:MAG: excinuclease ABC subunit UvrC [Mogibacterium sp.]|nr:excinuclease ABC subunit UvrC [Mogibacterium sp.]